MLQSLGRLTALHRQLLSTQQAPPNAFDHFGQIRSIVRSGRFGLFTDYDGTLSRIVSTPEKARISGRATNVLERLIPQISLVSVVSGRAVHDVRDKVSIDGILYIGNHGAEYLENGRLTVAPQAARYCDQIADALAYLRSKVQVAQIVWDYKKYSLAVHYRQVEDPEQTRTALQEAWEESPDAGLLELFWGKMVMEIRPPAGVDKGYAIERLVKERRLDSAIMIGDDTTDVDAFHAIRRLGGGTHGAGILVLHDDTAEILMRAGDYSLVGVDEVEKFLEWLVAVTDGGLHG